MSAHTLLATLTFPDERLFGASVWLSVALLGTGAFLVSPISPIHKPRIDLVKRSLPCVALVWGVLLRSPMLRDWLIQYYFYKQRYYQLDIAEVVTLSFGIGFSLSCVRSSDVRTRRVGWLAGTFFLGIVVVWVSEMVFTT